jgi:hypothetical protein
VVGVRGLGEPLRLETVELLHPDCIRKSLPEIPHGRKGVKIQVSRNDDIKISSTPFARNPLLYFLDLTSLLVKVWFRRIF